MRSILTINGGSSSIKFAVFNLTDSLPRGLHGKVERIGTGKTEFSFAEGDGGKTTKGKINGPDLKTAARSLIDWLQDRISFSTVEAVGHRIVHGLEYNEPQLVTPDVMAGLRRAAPYAPDHLPGEIELIKIFRQRQPKLRQVTCFDTAFHRTMPRVATILAIPRRFQAKGVQRYGFHGLSYSYLMEELRRLGDPAAKKGRIILAHLGNGASIAAVRDGKSIDTSMAFTPIAGLVMGTRCGDIDPGIVAFLARTEKISPQRFYQMASRESGMLGVSGISSDMQTLQERAKKDRRAAEAVDLFCYQARKWIGSFTAALGGLDTLVFAGGIGENAESVRARICDELGFLGIKLNGARNERSAGIISPSNSPVIVRVIRTDEELMIARSVVRILSLDTAA